MRVFMLTTMPWPPDCLAILYN
jgi:hypothetical protein